jgi:hypothetical protein
MFRRPGKRVFAHYDRQGQDIKFAHNSPGSQCLFNDHRHRENSGDALYVGRFYSR